jgi:hypothetical protein
MTIKIIPNLPHARGLGRHINWDPRSKAFRVQRRTSTPESKWWPAMNAIALDQGGLGACTGYAAAQCLNSSPFYRNFDGRNAEYFYQLATTLDPFDGQWPPDDTGSDGLSVMKALVKLGHVKSYTHCFCLDDVIQGLQTGPGIAGINWFEGFDGPDAQTGLVKVSGVIRGGHEITIQGVDLDECLVWFRTSYGPFFGVEHNGLTGCFCMTFPTAQSILFTDGDACFPSNGSP